MKHALALFIAMLMMTGCTAPTSENDTNDSDKQDQTNTNAVLRTGLGIATSFSMQEPAADEAGTATAELTCCAVTLDDQGKITSVLFDTVEGSAIISADGKIELPESVSSKKTLGDSYGMKAISSIGKEWYEQVAALEAYCVGKTVSDVSSMQLTTKESRTGVPAVEELTSSCTISVSSFLEALKSAESHSSARLIG